MLTIIYHFLFNSDAYRIHQLGDLGQVAVDTGTSMLAGPSRVIHELTRRGFLNCYKYLSNIHIHT